MTTPEIIAGLRGLAKYTYNNPGDVIPHLCFGTITGVLFLAGLFLIAVAIINWGWQCIFLLGLGMVFTGVFGGMTLWLGIDAHKTWKKLEL